MLPAIFLIAVGAAFARADVATWSWSVSDTGNANGLVEPGESALLTLAMAFDPPQPQFGGMFAHAGTYDILGNANWAAGTIDAYDMRLDWYSGDPVIDGENNILNVEHFQFPVAFDDAYDKSNPIDLFFIRWTPTDYGPADVTLDNSGPDAWIYTDAFGEKLLYSGEGGSVSFRVVPGPATAGLAFAAICCMQRRRR